MTHATSFQFRSYDVKGVQAIPRLFFIFGYVAQHCRKVLFILKRFHLYSMTFPVTGQISYNDLCQRLDMSRAFSKFDSEDTCTKLSNMKSVVQTINLVNGDCVLVNRLQRQSLLVCIFH